jgi:glycosyltransferase involved in cell wall biosynthesis
VHGNVDRKPRSTGDPLRIHWFSPLPPAHTDIAHYTSRVLRPLAARAEVTLWTDQPYWSGSLERHAAVRRFDPGNFPWDALNRADAVFYNIGNDSRFHPAITMVSRRFPGFSIMHDTVLHDSVFHDYHERAHPDRGAYLGIMQSIYGPRGLRDATIYWNSDLPLPVMNRMSLDMSRRYSCAPHFLECSLGAIVHSRAAERALAEEADVPVACLPLPFPSKGAPRPVDLSPPWKLVVFGYLGLNRCVEQTLSAVAQLRRLPFHLHIYGEDRTGAAAAIERLGIADRVTVHGFVPEHKLDAALASSHLAINLRYPTKGEASGAQLRIWSHGLPSIVTRVGWYAELPPGTVHYVSPNFMIEDLCAHLQGYAARPADYAASGLRGYEYFFERHSPTIYAAKIVELAARAAEYRDRWNGLRIGRRVVEEVRGWLPEEALGGYLGHLAGKVTELAGTMIQPRPESLSEDG